MATREREKDLELLLPVSNVCDDKLLSPPPRPPLAESSHRSPSEESSQTLHPGNPSGHNLAIHSILCFPLILGILQGHPQLASKKFMSGCVILFPIAVTFYITRSFIHFMDVFSPAYYHLGINVFENVISGGTSVPKRLTVLDDQAKPL